MTRKCWKALFCLHHHKPESISKAPLQQNVNANNFNATDRSDSQQGGCALKMLQPIYSITDYAATIHGWKHLKDSHWGIICSLDNYKLHITLHTVHSDFCNITGYVLSLGDIWNLQILCVTHTHTSIDFFKDISLYTRQNVVTYRNLIAPYFDLQGKCHSPFKTQTCLECNRCNKTLNFRCLLPLFSFALLQGQRTFHHILSNIILLP